MIDKGSSDSYIQTLDKEKAEEVESFMERVTLPQNTLQYIRHRGKEPTQPNDLRVVLVGKVRKDTLSRNCLFEHIKSLPCYGLTRRYSTLPLMHRLHHGVMLCTPCLYIVNVQ